ncbi:DUF2513 domain-containing protein [uncultured Parolsenella sp.]|uniref:DUF2513 domain-containing protein n=1 Tax=uncultured Parolsenella sp. TaxID=2083008 RepID=UPI0027D9C1BF|nr:DUF2513 domain-containing protein [uncultured Parolsenella sp.]
MKRDMDLVRCILMTVEKADGEVTDSRLLDCTGDIGRLAFHVELLQSHGLLVSEVFRDGMGDPMSVSISGLTWEGYDYLDAIRSQKVWNKAKEAISKAVGDTSLSVVKDICVALAASLVKQQLGI